MKITEFLKDNIVYLDGGMGTLLQGAGLAPGEMPERWSISHRAVVREIHRAYFDAGSHVVSTNTFGANALKFSHEELDAVIGAGVKNARAAAAESTGTQPKWIALDIGPTGRMLKPLGDLDFEDAVSLFGEVVRLGVKYGVDLIFIETMNDAYETKAAVLAAKENSTLPVFVSNAYGADGKLMTGASPAAMVAMLEGLGVDAIGANCSLGPHALRPVVEEYLRCASVPVLLKPNAGMPRVEGGKTVYDVAPADFATELCALLSLGLRLAGGCCGTTPAYIAALTAQSRGVTPKPLTDKGITAVSSYTHAVTLGGAPVLIGERINPTGKKRFKEALRAGDMDYILREGIAEEERGVHILDVNVGLPEIDESAVLEKTVCALQEVTALPLQIDTADPASMERALRRYNGKAMINSVSGKAASMAEIFPLAKKYGGVVVALTLDEQGIPTSAEGRVEIAKRILAEAEKYGIAKKDLVFDPLAMAVSADPTAAEETLRAVKMLHALGCHTSLGVSNVSFGLPGREMLTASFFTLAMGQGLTCAIMNPHAVDMMRAYHAYLALSGQDESFAKYIAFAESQPNPLAAVAEAQKSVEVAASELQGAIAKGLKERAASLTRTLLEERDPLSVVESEIIPALNSVGEGFEKKTVYLPGLLMSAEAAKAAFEVIKSKMQGGGATRCSVVLATVKGDIHDIGKNIVKLLFENYGFAVTDLGRDVLPNAVLDTVTRLKAPLVGLSALMTTTVPAMAETVALLREHAPWCRIMVGGAVLTGEYAAAIGADFYAKDAMAGVRYAEEIDLALKK